MPSVARRENGPTMQVNNNKRGQTRFRNQLAMQIEMGAERHEARSRDLSLGGTFIETPFPLKEGARIRLRFTVPTQPDPIITEAQVRWTEAGGAGICFGALRAREMWALTKYLGEHL
jgi:PilZ domain-containing protein